MTTHSPLVREVSIDGEFIMEAPVESGHSGNTTLSVGPTIQVSLCTIERMGSH